MESIERRNKYHRLTRTRLISLLVAAAAGAVSSVADLLAAQIVVIVGFVVACCAEILLMTQRHEQRWYSARAASESIKTLVWKYAVGAEPFGISLVPDEAYTTLIQRIDSVRKNCGTNLDIEDGDLLVDDLMRKLRNAQFEARRSAYLAFRVHQQRAWYRDKARENERRARTGQLFLVVGEVCAVVVAVGTPAIGWRIDIAGVLAAVLAAVAAWVAVKQYSQLAAAYGTAATELALQEEILKTASEQRFPQAVADAEQAMNREHTMWLASRGMARP